jgi:hypothetical protein
MLETKAMNEQRNNCPADTPQEAGNINDSMPSESSFEEPKIDASASNKPSITPLEATIILARRGNKKILPRLRQLLHEQPELWQHFGNLASQAQETWLKLIAGDDLYFAETVRLHLDTLRQELIGSGGNPVIHLLADRVLACHLQLLFFEATEGQILDKDNPRLAVFNSKRQDQAHRQYLSAIKMLATVRQMMSKTIHVELLHQPSAPSPVQVELKAHGELPEIETGIVNHFEVPLATQPLRLFNGVNRVQRQQRIPEPVS